MKAGEEKRFDAEDGEKIYGLPALAHFYRLHTWCDSKAANY